METFDWLLIFIVLILLGLAFYYCYSCCRKLSSCKEQFDNLRNTTELLDLQVEGLKLLLRKYKANFPENLSEEIECECKKAQKKADVAKNYQELFDAKLLEERWRIVQKCVLCNL